MPTKVAIIHDWLLGYRGGERLVEALCDLYPQAEIFTLFHKPGSVPFTIERHRIHTSFLNAIPGSSKIYRHLLPLMPMAIESFDLSRFDLIISSSTCVAKGVIPPPYARHICYCNTPMRYAWDRYRDYFGGRWLEPLLYPFIHYLRMWDVTSSARVDHFIANSDWIGKRIEKYYRRDSTTVYPFVDLAAFSPKPAPGGDYYLVVSAFAPYKRVDLAIEACRELGKPLWIAGDGQDAKALRKLAGPDAVFLGALDAKALAGVFRGAKALLFPGEEDFGITPLEAMASGTPVIAFGRGGATETVVDGETGVLFEQQSVESLKAAIQKFETLPLFSPERCRKRSQEFSRERFVRGIAEVVSPSKEVIDDRSRPSREPLFPN